MDNNGHQWADFSLKDLGRLLIERVQENIRNYTFQGKTPWHLTLSFGAAGFPGDAQTSEELVRKADEALFLAKETGKNKICIYGT